MSMQSEVPTEDSFGMNCLSGFQEAYISLERVFFVDEVVGNFFFFFFVTAVGYFGFKVCHESETD